jgi:hypothetical protein
MPRLPCTLTTPDRGPGDKGSFDSRRFQITSMMRTLAEVAGDVDAAVEVLARDQSSPYQFVLIAERLRDAGRYDDALAWAQKGLELFACEDSRLVDAATREYHRAGRGPEAVALVWRAYEERTTPAGSQRLCEQARLALSRSGRLVCRPRKVSSRIVSVHFAWTNPVWANRMRTSRRVDGYNTFAS